MKYPTKILRPEVDSYNVECVTERYQKMNDSYNEGDFGETVNYARSMVESTCKYTYRQLKGTHMDKDFGIKPLPSIVEKCLEVLYKEISLPESYNDLASKMIDTMKELGKIRNKTSVSHGSDVRTEDISAPEAKYAAFMAEGFTVFILELLFNKTHSMKNNAIGSVINTDNLQKISEDKSYIEYKNNQFKITYMVTQKNNTIFQVEIQLPAYIQFDESEEFFSDHIKGFVEDDVQIVNMKQTGINQYQYYSPKKDFYYEVSINKVTNVLYISRDYGKN